MEIVKKAQQFIEFSALELKDQEDFVPFVIVADAEGREFFFGFTEMPVNPEAKDQLADIIMALCVVRGAVEIAFGSAAWYAESTIGDVNDAPPSQRPDRKEVAIVSVAGDEGVNTVFAASVVRENNKVGIGLWEKLPASATAGRFAEALHMGLKLSRKLPPETRAFLDEQIKEGLEDALIESTAATISKARRTALYIQKRGELK